MAKRKRSFIIYDSWATMLANLPDQEAGQLIKRICCFELGATPPDCSPTIEAIFSSIQPQLEMDEEKYRETCEKRSAAAHSRWNPT